MLNNDTKQTSSGKIASGKRMPAETCWRSTRVQNGRNVFKTGWFVHSAYCQWHSQCKFLSFFFHFLHIVHYFFLILELLFDIFSIGNLPCSQSTFVWYQWTCTKFLFKLLVHRRISSKCWYIFVCTLSRASASLFIFSTIQICLELDGFSWKTHFYSLWRSKRDSPGNG